MSNLLPLALAELDASLKDFKLARIFSSFVLIPSPQRLSSLALLILLVARTGDTHAFFKMLGASPPGLFEKRGSLCLRLAERGERAAPYGDDGDPPLLFSGGLTVIVFFGGLLLGVKTIFLLVRFNRGTLGSLSPPLILGSDPVSATIISTCTPI